MQRFWFEGGSALADQVTALSARTHRPNTPSLVVRLAGYRHFVVWAVIALSFVAGAIESARAKGLAANVDAARITGADQDPANWTTYGRTYSEQRFSPLSKITADNVGQLGLAWFADLETSRGQEATPLVIDGVMYVSTAWSMVKAFDAKTGSLLWSYDPAVPRELGVRGCCDVVNRGVAAWKGKIYVGTFDGRLVALDAQTGRQIWSVMTVDPDKPYTITQAPRVIKGRVVIGNSGAEYGVRGYISAYKRGRSRGGSIRYPAIQPILLNSRFSQKPPRLGMASGGRKAAAERCGKACPMIPSSTSSISVSATGSNGTRATAARARVTIGSYRQSWRSTPILAHMHGTTSVHPARSGILMLCSSSSLPTSRSTESLAKS